MTPEKWFERRFDAQPASRFPVILERLRGTPARLEERLRDVPSARLTTRLDSAWSAQENVGHLIDLESLWHRRAEQLFAGEPELAPTDLANRRTFEAGHNDRPLADLLAEFRRVRQAFVALLTRADDASLSHTALHPRLRTPMTLTDLAHFVAEHDDHHLATIAALVDRPRT
ncbi:MAG: DinB family protein [Vicinamibacterales bacterium]